MTKWKKIGGGGVGGGLRESGYDLSLTEDAPKSSNEKNKPEKAQLLLFLSTWGMLLGAMTQRHVGPRP